VIDIPTDAGLGRGYVLPNPVPQLSLIDVLINAFLGSINANDIVTCAPDPSVTVAASCSAALQTRELTQNSRTKHRVIS
jgi:hypothetical protein